MTLRSQWLDGAETFWAMLLTQFRSLGSLPLVIPQRAGQGTLHTSQVSSLVIITGS